MNHECPACGHEWWDMGKEEYSFVQTRKILDHDVEVSKDGDGDWYIRVWSKSGSYLYDGFWYDSNGKTVEDAFQEAREGACLDEQEQP